MVFIEIIKRELKIAFRKKAEIFNPLWFFLIVLTLFPLVIGPDPKLLAKIAPALLGWQRYCPHYYPLSVYFGMILSTVPWNN